MSVIAGIVLIIMLLLCFAHVRANRPLPGFAYSINPAYRIHLDAFLLPTLNRESDMSKVLPLLSIAVINAIFLDSANRPVAHADIQGVPVWAIDNPSLATLNPAADGFTAQITTGSTEGDVTVTITAVGIVVAGTENLTGKLVIPIQDIAASVQLSLGEASPIPPVPTVGAEAATETTIGAAAA